MNTPKAAATHDSEGTPANSQASAPAAAPIECWQCATQQGPFVQGVHLLCNDCDAGERREYAEQELYYRSRDGVVRVRQDNEK